MGTFSGEATTIFFFASHLNGIQLLKEGEQILSFRSTTHLEKAMLCRKANRKSQKLFPICKNGKKKNGGGVLICLTCSTSRI